MSKKNTEKKVEVESMEKEKSSFKGYGILILIFALCIGLTLYICKWYNVYQDYQKETPVIRGTLSEIGNDEFEHYVLDNPTSIIYMCTSREDVCRNFENEFKKLVIKKEYNDEIIYLNLTDLDQEKFVKEFNDKYNFKVKLTENYPAFVVFSDGEVDAILQGDEEKPITISRVKEFIELYKTGE